MNEQLLFYIWRNQLFDAKNLKTTQNRPIRVLHPGFLNTNAGPDFTDSRIKLDGITWVGRIEIHVNSSDWFTHGHQADQKYANTILHVVWNDNQQVFLPTGEIPTLELKSRISADLLDRYQKLNGIAAHIPCESMVQNVPTIIVRSMTERALIERIQAKSTYVLEMLSKTKNDWEQTSFQALLRAFGGNINQEPFERLARMLSVRKLARLSSRLELEALLFGQAGFLEEIKDDHQLQLKEAYLWLSKKFDLPQPLSRFHWNFHRIRPSAFPTIRIAQLTMLLHNRSSIYDMMRETESKDDIQVSMLEIDPYWMTHYDFGRRSKQKRRQISNGFIDQLIINAFVPVLAASSKYFDDESLMNRAVSWMESLKPENNQITRKFLAFDQINDSAATSQGLIQLYKNYCQKKRCLHCNIGTALLRN
jgi:hypothetical protein